MNLKPLKACVSSKKEFHVVICIGLIWTEVDLPLIQKGFLWSTLNFCYKLVYSSFQSWGESSIFNSKQSNTNDRLKLFFLLNIVTIEPTWTTESLHRHWFGWCNAFGHHPKLPRRYVIIFKRKTDWFKTFSIQKLQKPN